MRARLCAFLALWLSLLSGTAQGEEIAPFRVTGTEGNVTVRYVSDTATTGNAGGAAATRQSQSGLRSELFAMSHSYVYHPNLLSLDIGGGPILYAESVAGPAGASDARGMLFNFTGRATFLRDKPYRAGLFFEHLNPTVSLAPGQVMQQENMRYGVELSLLAPVTPVPLQLAFTRSSATGRGSERVVSDSIDQMTLNASRSYGESGSTQLQFLSSHQTSMSGSQSLPLQSTTLSNQALNLDTRLQFGSERQYDLANVISINSQRYAFGTNAYPDLNDQRVMLDFRTRHADTLSSYGTYSYSHSAQGSLDSTVHNAAAGLSYRPQPGLEAALNARGDNTATRQYTTQAYGVDGNVRYEHALPVGVAQVSYSARYDERAQQALTPQADVLGERLTLNNTAFATLGRPRIVAGTLVVSNATRTQTFVSGIDYLVTTLGLDTRIQRLIGGAILDGEEVLVDYAYDVGGIYAYRQLDQTLNLSWSYLHYLNVFFRQSAANPRLVSGMPTFPLNTVSSSIFGVRADLPFNPGFAFTVGGGFEYESRTETIAPFRRMAADAYVQTDEPLFGLGFFRYTQRMSRTDYGNSTQNVDLQGYDLRYWTRQWFGIDLTAALTGERDASGFLPRSRIDGSIGLQWQERKFSLSGNLVRSHESQGSHVRNRTTFQLLARRTL